MDDNDGQTERDAVPIEKSALERRAAIGDMVAVGKLVAQDWLAAVDAEVAKTGETRQQAFDRMLASELESLRLRRAKK